MKKKFAAALLALSALTLTACETDADIASHNLSRQAEDFKIMRNIVFFNGITDTYLLEITGRCSVETGDSLLKGSLEVTCKVADDEYKKHFLGLSDNVSYFVEQIESADVSTYHYQVVFKPQSIVPDIDFQGSTRQDDLPQSQP